MRAAREPAEALVGGLTSPDGEGADVVVAGGGNAALVAALEARAAGARVLLLERPRVARRQHPYTRNIRCAHDGYPEEELLSDLAGVTGDDLDRELTELTVRESRSGAELDGEPGRHPAECLSRHPAARANQSLAARHGGPKTSPGRLAGARNGWEDAADASCGESAACWWD